MTDLTEQELEYYFFLCLEERLQALAMPAEVQLTLFPKGCAKVEELALEFNYALGMKWSAKRRRITPEQDALLHRIDSKLDEMSAPKPFWTEDALRRSPKWEAVRDLAKEVLTLFGWKVEAPQMTHEYTYREDGSISSSTTMSMRHRQLVEKWERERQLRQHDNETWRLQAGRPVILHTLSRRLHVSVADRARERPTI